jgi:hypothetical protein
VRRSIAWAALAALAASTLACGGEERQVEEPQPQSSEGVEWVPPRDSMQVSGEGFMGTIPEHKINGTLEPKMSTFQRCFFEGAEVVAFIGGHIKLYFRVGLDGRVEWVHPRGSSIGHRGTEQCIVAAAKKTRFPKPRGGGPAEFVWGFDLEPNGRPPVDWDESRVRSRVDAQAASLAGCGIDDFRYIVTAYVAVGGHVLSAGAAADSQEAADKIDCVLEAVQAWEFPDPGSFPAKVSFELP